MGSKKSTLPTKIELFEELAQPDENGMSRWVSTEEFVGRYAELKLGNGAGWSRSDGPFGRKYVIEKDTSKTPGNRVDAIRTVGFAFNERSAYIDPAIKNQLRKRTCVVLGTSNPEIDHKNGMKNDDRVMKNEGQSLSDFQPLSKAANDAKRQFCKECKQTGIRFDAKRLGYPMSYYTGGSEHHDEVEACVGCYWYDPLEFKKHLKWSDEE